MVCVLGLSGGNRSVINSVERINIRLIGTLFLSVDEVAINQIKRRADINVELT